MSRFLKEWSVYLVRDGRLIGLPIREYRGLLAAEKFARRCLGDFTRPGFTNPGLDIVVQHRPSRAIRFSARGVNYG